MMHKPEVDIPDCYRQIRAKGVKRYLVGQGWNLRSDSRPGFLWFDGVNDADGQPIDLVLPEDECAADYDRLLRLLVIALCHIERRAAEEIVENLIAHDPPSLAAG